VDELIEVGQRYVVRIYRVFDIVLTGSACIAWIFSVATPSLGRDWSKPYSLVILGYVPSRQSMNLYPWLTVIMWRTTEPLDF
jgi:hypothetical protein